MSLRNRLVLGILLLTAVGLISLAAVTYFEQHSFLYKRLDQQLNLAPHAVAEGLHYQQLQKSQPSPDAGSLPEPPTPATGAPAGTYGQLRSSTGALQATIFFRYNENITNKAILPKKIPLNHPVTIGSYRVLAIPVKETTVSGVSTGTIVAAIPLHDTQATLSQLLLVEALVVSLALALVGGGAWLYIKRGLRPLEEFSKTAEDISEGDFTQRVQGDPHTEVGRLGVAFNSMLDKIQAAFSERQESEDRLRQFVADASHELRTPLTSIRGYAEIYRIASDEDKQEAMQRIEAEAERMGVLVSNLLTLARLDQLPEIKLAEVDVGEIMIKTVQDLRVANPEREIICDTQTALIVNGDAYQLQQVITNLIGNALLYTKGQVEAEVARDGDKILIRIRDHGEGLPSDTALVFERFWKGPGSPEAHAHGAGLGLSIVMAIVRAHQGTIKAENLASGGALFTVSLPAKQ